MPTIEQLDQRNPCVDYEEEEDLEAIYKGGKHLEKRLERFLPQRPREPNERYRVRKNEYHIRNYTAAIIDYFAAMLFTSKPSAVAKDEKGEVVLQPDDFYSRFREDCDRLGGDIDAFFKGRLTEGMVQRRAWFSLEQPDAGSEEPGARRLPPASRADFEREGIGSCWLRALDHDYVLDWELDDTGALAWVLVKSKSRKRSSLIGSRSEVTEIWEHYQVDRVDTYAITYDEKNKPTSATDVPRIGTRYHTFGRVPVVCMELPEALWVANRLKTAQLAHFRAINAQSWSLAATCYAMPVAKVKDPDSAAMSNMAHGAGYAIYLYPDESWEWEAPPTDHFAALDTEIKSLKDEIFRIAHQMALGVENNAAAVGRSGQSKQQDHQSTRVVLTAYGRVVKEAIELVYDMVSAARGDSITWSIGGLDDFAAVDTDKLLEMAVALNGAGGIPSKAFNTDFKYKLATSLLPDTDEARKQAYLSEIEEATPDGTEEQDLLKELLSDAHSDQGGDRAGGGKKPPKAPGGRKRGAAAAQAKAP